MFISSYEKLRNYILSNTTITSLIQLEYNAFAPACIPVSTFTITNFNHPMLEGGYVRLSDFLGSENQAPKTLEAIRNPDCGWFFRASSSDFKKIPHNPIAYWISKKIFGCFEKNEKIKNIAHTKSGMSTTDNQQFLRLWHETSFRNIGFNYETAKMANRSWKKWFPYSKGGIFRKWYGNQEYVVNWQSDGKDIRACIAADPAKQVGGRIVNEEFYFIEGVGWSDLTSGHLSSRLQKKGFIVSSR